MPCRRNSSPTDTGFPCRSGGYAPSPPAAHAACRARSPLARWTPRIQVDGPTRVVIHEDLRTCPTLGRRLSSMRDEGRGRDIPHRSMHGHRRRLPRKAFPRGCRPAAMTSGGRPRHGEEVEEGQQEEGQEEQAEVTGRADGASACGRCGALRGTAPAPATASARAGFDTYDACRNITRAGKDPHGVQHHALSASCSRSRAWGPALLGRAVLSVEGRRQHPWES